MSSVCTSASSTSSPPQSSVNASLSVPAAMQSIVPVSSLPVMHDVATVTRILKQEGQPPIAPSQPASQPASQTITRITRAHYLTPACMHTHTPAAAHPAFYSLNRSCTHSHARSLTGALCASSGFNGVFQWTDSPSAVYPPHTHQGCSAHYILRGAMTVHYPDTNHTFTYRAGDRFDVPAGMVHRASMGEQGCTYVVGEK